VLRSSRRCGGRRAKLTPETSRGRVWRHAGLRQGDSAVRPSARTQRTTSGRVTDQQLVQRTHGLHHATGSLLDEGVLPHAKRRPVAAPAGDRSSGRARPSSRYRIEAPSGALVAASRRRHRTEVARSCPWQVAASR
jgi:hypothetical protein